MTTPIFTTSRNVVFTDFEGGEGILVDLNTKKYYQLNETAKLVWQALSKGRSLNEIVDQIMAEYEVDKAHALKSVERVVNNFQSYKLVDQS